MMIKRMRRKAKNSKREWYGLKSLSSPKPVKELIPFENKFISLVKNIKFRKVRNISKSSYNKT